MSAGFRFKHPFDVRDYECDLQGVVNNAVYLRYLEHARHMFLRSLGIDFAILATRKINLVVIRIEIDYLQSLRSGDTFYVTVDTERISRLRFGFNQKILRLPDESPVVNAKVIGAALNEKGRPFIPSDLDVLFV